MPSIPQHEVLSDLPVVVTEARASIVSASGVVVIRAHALIRLRVHGDRALHVLVERRGDGTFVARTNTGDRGEASNIRVALMNLVDEWWAANVRGLSESMAAQDNAALTELDHHSLSIQGVLLALLPEWR